MRYLLSIIIFSLILTSCSSFGQTTEQASNPSLAEAHQAYSPADHTKAYGLFKNIWEDENQKLKDRVEAARYLARMDWRFYGKNRKAMNTIVALEKVDHELSLTYILKARILASEEKFKEAVEWSKKAINASTSITEKYKATMAYGTHVFSQVESQILKGARSSPSVLSSMNESFALLHDLMNDQKDDVELGRLFLGYSLLLRDGKEAFRAWKLFYRVTNDNPVHPSLMKSVDSFENALSNYKRNSGSKEDIETIIYGLAESGFYQYASLVKKIEFGNKIHSDNRINEIVQYAHFIRRLEKVTIDFYQGTVSESMSVFQYTAKFQEECEAFWNKMDWPNGKPAFSHEAFSSTIRERFKGLLTRFRANNYYGLHFGHVMLDDRRQINQYGESAEFRYVVIDNMVSNGYTSWFGDGDNEVGGWAPGDESFLQVRTAMNSAPKKIWALVSDPVEIMNLQERVDQLSKSDERTAKKNPYAFLPGLKWRLIQREINNLADSLRSLGFEKGELRYAFISSVERIMEGSAIYAHEGRHAIDQKNGYLNVSKELEYTAKLSEVYFSEMPFLSFQSILQGNIGNSSSHGQANLKMITNLVKWMDNHQQEIKGFDPTKPTLPQLDKLTDKQLKAAVRSLDPMAN